MIENSNLLAFHVPRDPGALHTLLNFHNLRAATTCTLLFWAAVVTAGTRDSDGASVASRKQCVMLLLGLLQTVLRRRHRAGRISNPVLILAGPEQVRVVRSPPDISVYATRGGVPSLRLTMSCLHL